MYPLPHLSPGYASRTESRSFQDFQDFADSVNQLASDATTVLGPAKLRIRLCGSHPNRWYLVVKSSESIVSGVRQMENGYGVSLRGRGFVFEVGWLCLHSSERTGPIATSLSWKETSSWHYSSLSLSAGRDFRTPVWDSGDVSHGVLQLQFTDEHLDDSTNRAHVGYDVSGL